MFDNTAIFSTGNDNETMTGGYPGKKTSNLLAPSRKKEEKQ